MSICHFIPEAGSNPLMSIVFMAIRAVIAVTVSIVFMLLLFRLLPEYKDAKRVVMKLIKRK